MKSLIATERNNFLKRVNTKIVRMKKGRYGHCPNFSDKDSKKSVLLGNGIVERLPGPSGFSPLSGQGSGAFFEQEVKLFLENTFSALSHLRPGRWLYWQKNEKDKKITSIANFEQYAHLAELSEITKKYAEVADVLGHDYFVKPDVLIARLPEPDEHINRKDFIVDENEAKQTPIRLRNNNIPILHATVSCKWSIRSDRSQNTRTEALNLIRNRKGPLPHIVAVTMEPLPSRLASLCIGTGDIDCVYHAALYELNEAAETLYRNGAIDKDDVDFLKALQAGKRLRDISDLPLDICV